MYQLSLWVVVLIAVQVCGKEEESSSEVLATSVETPAVANGTQNATEELPQPEALFGASIQPSTNYIRVPSSFNGRTPFQLTPYQIMKHLEARKTESDYFYRNRKGEWIYIVPEEELLTHLVDPGSNEYRRPVAREKTLRHNNGYPRKGYVPSERFRGEEKRDSKVSADNSRYYPRHYRTPTNRGYPGSSHHGSDDSGSFFKKVIDTGTGILRYLNPLTYLRPNDPGPSIALYQRVPYKGNGLYRPKQIYRNVEDRDHMTPHDYIRKDRVPFNSNYPYEISKDFTHDYRDYSYASGEHHIPDKSEDSSKTKEQYHPDQYKYSQGLDSSPPTPSSYDSKYDDEYKYVENEDSSRTDYDNIYKFQDLDMLYDGRTVDKLENVQDERTIEYLKENKLRKDIYIGDDGNLYLRENKEETGDFLGYEMYGMDRLKPSRVGYF